MVEERGHVLRLLGKTKEAIRKEDVIKLKNLSNQTIHSASIHQDADSITLAVIIYSLSKILERTSYQKYPDWKKFIKHITQHIDNAIYHLKQDKQDRFKKELQGISKDISKLSGDFKRHVRFVFEKARINKASRIYEHGISMEKTSKLLGITIWELAEYAGKTGIPDINLNVTKPIKQRIKLAMELFS
jgi:hypothetical protein